MGTAAFITALACWAAFGAALYVNHRRIRRIRGPESKEARQRSLRAQQSMYGLLLEGLAIAIGCGIHRPLAEAATASLIAAMLIGPASVLLTILSLRHLGDQWRIKAVVTEDHRLITTGPYGLVRHPIYLAFFGVMLATSLVVAPWPALAAAVVIYLTGTEIRINAEDKILSQRFGAEFEAYRSRVKALLPYLR